MTLFFRIPKRTYGDIRRDLARPHDYAAERVGFAKARLGTAEGQDRIILITGYAPVNDDHYIDDPSSGARIDSNAIRRAMEIILQESVGLLHVHIHDFPGSPRLGKMDRREIPRLVDTFRATGPQAPHGILLLSGDSFSCWVWLPGQGKALVPERATVVGMPLFIRPPQ